MNATRPAEILRQLEQSGAADAELLARFVATKDTAAFADLVKRHGALVLGVCRRVTGHPQDAEDAFQATFLVLAQKAASLRNAALLGNWLYGVAFRVAWRARRSASRRRAREVSVSHLPEPHATSPSPALPELGPILDEELAALPACYREAIVLCDLRGASREEAATALGVPEGTLSSRLTNGRKKLAARLTKRGIAFSVAVLPLRISDVQAATILPNELLTKTCGLVADYATTGAVPGPLARLTEGGFAMRKMLVFGLVMVAAVSGAVFAARPNDAPPIDPPKPPIVTEKPVEQPAPRAEPTAKDVGKVIAYASMPKLQNSFDLPVWGEVTAIWNTSGTHLAITGRERGAGGGGFPERGPGGGWGGPPANRPVVWLFGIATGSKPIAGYPNDGTQLVAVMPDGKGVVTDLREYKLISGHHQLNYWDESKPPPPGGADGPGGGPPPGPMGPGGAQPEPPMLVVSKTVKLDSNETHGYAFAADGKTYRTVAYHRDGTGAIAKLEVVEMNTTNGSLVKSLLKLDYGVDARLHVLAPNGKRLAVLDKDVTKVTVYDVERGAKQSEYTFPEDKDKNMNMPAPTADQTLTVFSPDGKRLVVSRNITRTTVLNADTGEALPDLEGTKEAQTYPGARAFSGDGRLLAAISHQYVVRKSTIKSTGAAQTSWSGGDVVLTVWDTQSGKVLKTWNTTAKEQRTTSLRVAFCPTRPLLAIFEENGAGVTRVGFWDFAAEVEK